MGDVDSKDGTRNATVILQPVLTGDSLLQRSDDAHADVEDKSCKHHDQIQHLKDELHVLRNFEDAMVHISLGYHNSETNHSWNALTRKTFEPADFVLPRVSQHMRSDEDVVLVFSARKRLLAVKVQTQSVNESMLVL